MASDSSNTSGTELTPFLDSATHKYCFMAFINMSFVLKTGPAFCRMDNRSCRDRTLDRSSCDLKKKIIYKKVIPGILYICTQFNHEFKKS